MKKMSFQDLKNLFVLSAPDVEEKELTFGEIMKKVMNSRIRVSKHWASKKGFTHPNKKLSFGEQKHLQYIEDQKIYNGEIENFDNGEYDEV